MSCFTAYVIHNFGVKPAIPRQSPLCLKCMILHKCPNGSAILVSFHSSFNDQYVQVEINVGVDFDKWQTCITPCKWSCIGVDICISKWRLNSIADNTGTNFPLFWFKWMWLFVIIKGYSAAEYSHRDYRDHIDRLGGRGIGCILGGQSRTYVIFLSLVYMISCCICPCYCWL